MAVEIRSSATRDNPSLPSYRYRFLEWFVFTLVLFGGVFRFGIFAGGENFAVTILLGFSFLFLTLASVVVIPLLVYGDTRLIRSQDLDWQPRPAKWALIALVLTPLSSVLSMANPSMLPGMSLMQQFYMSLMQTSTPIVMISNSGVPGVGAIVYLFYRHRHLSSQSPAAYWWLLPTGVVVAGVLFLGAVLVIPQLSLLAVGLVIFLGCLFPIGVYLDSQYLRASEYSWKPNPALQFFLAFFCISVFPLSYLYPFYYAIYMTKRWSARP